ncbi:YfcE family phosphodiesterase [Clostridium bovifaecis]|uniref:Phosphoesterase n=1 Tax=Clostridium bovifaecis TaxID=2184719 RepID=A0A6I6EUS4_9CLOT|nr:YfcE family phosphodiesterase [Clostridium bovifaecis]
MIISRIGVISDTHGLLREEAVSSLEGVDLIIHAGDIGGDDIIEKLKRKAPVVAVRGNNDKGEWAKKYSKTEVVQIGEVCIYILHDINELDLDPTAAGFNVVISGHSHKPSIVEKNKVLYLNPGSAGPRRFKLPISIALLSVYKNSVSSEVVELYIR